MIAPLLHPRAARSGTSHCLPCPSMTHFSFSRRSDTPLMLRHARSTTIAINASCLLLLSLCLATPGRGTSTLPCTSVHEVVSRYLPPLPRLDLTYRYVGWVRCDLLQTCSLSPSLPDHLYVICYLMSPNPLLQFVQPAHSQGKKHTWRVVSPTVDCGKCCRDVLLSLVRLDFARRPPPTFTNFSSA